MKEGALRQLARKEGGLLKNGKISINWARKRYRSPRTSKVIKNRLRFFLNTVAKQKTGKAARKVISRRKKNPITNKAQKLKEAVSLYRRFREEEPEYYDDIEINWPTVGIVIGKCDGVLYSTTRGGKKEQYVHEFTGKSCPVLCSTFDGKQIFLIGGNYDFTEDGIVDR